MLGENEEFTMLRRLRLRTAGAGESTPGKFVHVDPKNAPRYDLRKPKHLPDPDITDISDDPMLQMDDPSLEMEDPLFSLPGDSSIAERNVCRICRALLER
jgi:hypothetical protein